MPLLQGKSLRKVFPGVVALDNVDITIASGTVHALVGANGAGKSTLVKILTGYYDSYEGQVFLDGQVITLKTPLEALRWGIAVVHQEVDTELVPILSVAENLYLETFTLGHPLRPVNLRHLQRRAEDDLTRLGFCLPVTAKVEDLSLHEKQCLVIARALLRKVQFLILDEPTASLSLKEAENLFSLVGDLKRKGVGILYISQRLDEVAKVADEITVLRDGKVAAYFDTLPPLTEVVQAMLGSPQEDLFPPREERQYGEVVLRVEGLRLGEKVRGVSFAVRRGEILVLTGLTGAGKTETLKLLGGALQPEGGTIYLEGNSLAFTEPAAAVRVGIYLTPEERRKEGLILDHPARENISLPFLRSFCGSLGVVRRTMETEYARQIAQRVQLRPLDLEREAQYFSGGNQQKILLGRWMGGRPKVLLLDEPTQGIDVGAKRELYRLIREVSRDTAVVVATSDINEAVGIGDRILVMRDGQIIFEVLGREAESETLLSYAAGVRSCSVTSEIP